jgi:PEP-CTERM motif
MKMQLVDYLPLRLAVAGTIVATAAGIMMATSALAATVIYSDDFEVFDRAPQTLVGQEPTVIGAGLGLDGNLYGNANPAAGFNETNVFFNEDGTGIAVCGQDNGVRLPLGADPEFSFSGLEKLSLSIQALSIVPTNSQATARRGVNLGFWNNAVIGANNNIGFTGIWLDREGNVKLGSQPTPAGINAIALKNIPGFDPTVPHTLSYDVNIVNGVFSNVQVDGGAPLTLLAVSDGVTPVTQTDLFKQAALLYAGFGQSAAAANTTGSVDNFSIMGSPVPEPASLALLAMSGVIAGAWMRCRR